MALPLSSEKSRGILSTWLGFLAYAVFALGTVSCEKSADTPDWDTPGQEAPVIESPAAQTAEAIPTDGKKNTSIATPATPEPSSSGLKFIAYNVENWLTMDRYVDRQQLKKSPKPAEEKQAVIRMMVGAMPDVIGLCEIGEAHDLAEIQQMLKAAGLDLPHSHYTGGSDSVRHLGLLSRLPIVSTSKPAETDFRLQGRTFSINRGILDVTINAHGKPYRFVGVHLKSKRSVHEADHEEMRVHEARLLRRHVDALLKQDPKARLIVYGDFNDTRPSRAFKTITGNYNDSGYLTAVPVKDSRGHAWTHHWKPHDVYSRIDFITVSRSLRPEVDFKNSHIIDSPDWDKASDHRPVVAIFY